MTVLFPTGVKGLADSKWSGVVGSVYRMVGLDIHSKPGIMRAHQALAKHSGSTIDELCKVALNLSDGSKLWFSSESGKIWREVSGTYTLVYTTVPTSGSAACLGAEEFEGWVIWATQNYMHKMPLTGIGTTWAGNAGLNSNFAAFARGDDTYHPFAKQNNSLFIGDNTVIAQVSEASASDTLTTTLGSSGNSASIGFLINPANNSIFPNLGNSSRSYSSSATTLTNSNFVVANTTNRVLFVVAFSIDTINTVNGITFGGVALTEVAQGNVAIAGGNGHYAIFRLINPSASTADIVTTWSASTSKIGMHCFVFSGVDQTTPVTGNATSEDSSSVTADITLSSTKECQIRIATVLSANVTHTQASGQNVIVEVTESASTDSTSYTGALGDFDSQTSFNVKAPERITTMIPYDVDLIIGTIEKTIGRALRWDTISDSWTAQDDLPDGGVKAFLKDDNYVYAMVGDFGRVYFYNGEKLEPFFRVPGDYSPSAKMLVNPNSVGFWNGVPIFGVSNSTGNPNLQGVYSFGSYNKDYAKVLDLSFPISSGEFTGMSIGAIIIDGLDLYVAWKGSATVGVDKLNWSAKYASAYFETGQLVDSADRGFLKTLKRFQANYASLPTNTDLALKYDKNYTGSYTTMTSVKDTNLMQKRAAKSINKIGALTLRCDFTVSGNNSPEVENFEYFFNNQKVGL